MDILLSEFHFLRPFWLIGVPLTLLVIFVLRKKWWLKGDWDKEIESHLLDFLATNTTQQQDQHVNVFGVVLLHELLDIIKLQMTQLPIHIIYPMLGRYSSNPLNFNFSKYKKL